MSATGRDRPIAVQHGNVRNRGTDSHYTVKRTFDLGRRMAGPGHDRAFDGSYGRVRFKRTTDLQIVHCNRRFSLRVRPIEVHKLNVDYQKWVVRNGRRTDSRIFLTISLLSGFQIPGIDRTLLPDHNLRSSHITLLKLRTPRERLPIMQPDGQAERYSPNSLSAHIIPSLSPYDIALGVTRKQKQKNGARRPRFNTSQVSIKRSEVVTDTKT